MEAFLNGDAMLLSPTGGIFIGVPACERKYGNLVNIMGHYVTPPQQRFNCNIVNRYLRTQESQTVTSQHCVTAVAGLTVMLVTHVLYLRVQTVS